MLRRFRNVPQFTTDTDLLYVSGKTYNSGIVIKDASNQYGNSTINTDGKYQKMKISVAGTVDNNVTVMFTDADTDQLLKSIDITIIEKTVEFDLNAAKKVEIRYSYKGKTGGKVVMGNVFLK